MSAHKEAPPTAVLLLGYGGLMPFAAALAGVLFDRAHLDAWIFALLAYAAVIASFVGALHWAFAMAMPAGEAPLAARSYLWSVLPALVAWVALLATHFSARQGGVIAAALLTTIFVLHYARDRALAGVFTLPSWYLPLRLRLSGVACLCLVISAAAVWWRT